MGIWRSIRGVCRVEIVCADPSELMRYVAERGIQLSSVIYINPLTIQTSIYRKDMGILISFLEERGADYKILSRMGLYWKFAEIIRRPVLICGLLMLLLIILYLPGKILFVQIEGNSAVPTNLILEKASLCGIRFGANRKSVRSEQMKNNLLSALPELKWAGINTRGCIAIISVGEREPIEEMKIPHAVTSIIAKLDCVIQDMTVIRGNPICAPGQAVKAGQLLVSGYTDCGISVRAESAEAEIFGLTMRKLSVKAPAILSNKGVMVDRKTIYSIKIGKNLIKISNCSGISPAVCDKMYEEKYVVLPGGFYLPISLVKETVQEYTFVRSDPDAYHWVAPEAERYLQSQMIAGKILQRTVIDTAEDGYYYHYGNYACLELVGQVRGEEIVKGNE